MTTPTLTPADDRCAIKEMLAEYDRQSLIVSCVTVIPTDDPNRISVYLDGFACRIEQVE